jgi:hypothetical protein
MRKFEDSKRPKNYLCSVSTPFPLAGKGWDRGLRKIRNEKVRRLKKTEKLIVPRQ